MTTFKAYELQKREGFDALTQCDVIMGPTTPTAAFKAGDKSADLALRHP